MDGTIETQTTKNYILIFFTTLFFFYVLLAHCFSLQMFTFHQNLINLT